MPLPLEAEFPPLRMDEHGICRLGTTKLPLEYVLQCFLRNESPEQIEEQFPAATPELTYAVIAYYLRHREAVDEYMRQRQEEDERILAEIRVRFPPTDLIRQLEARRAKLLAS